MTLLEKMCKEIGVEVGEEWRGNDNFKYKIEGKFLHKKDVNGKHWGYAENEAYWKLLAGEIKPKWKPKKGEEYYVPFFDEEITERYDWNDWDNTSTDNWFFENGLAYKTKEQAIEGTNKILEMLKEE